ncbi:MAG TPA: peptidylprolyl isomerase [Burkholderiaceae bacterium]|nr:peptidylprolyl isomerase [Burkholderiaceae bacterium]
MKDKLFSRTARLSLVAAALALAAGAAFAQLRAPGQGGAPSLRLPGNGAVPVAPPVSETPGAPGSGALPAGSGALPPAADPQAAPVPDERQDMQPRPASRELDRIVAVVNKDVITLRELERRAAITAEALGRQGVQLPPHEVLLRQLLERMIIDRAQVQLAREQGLRVDEAQLDAAVATIARENSLSLAQLRERIEREGRSFASFREDIRGEILRTRLREREVDSRVQVSEADIDAFLAAQGMQPAAAATAEYQVAHILIRVPEGATAEQIEPLRQQAEELRSRAQAGESFATLAAAASDAPDALQGGQLGWRTAERLPELFAEAVASLSPGELSPVLRSPGGFHLLMLTDRRDSAGSSATRSPGSAAVTQTHARHILMRPSEVLTEDEAIRRLHEIRERVLAGTADFADMARQYSSDGSAGRGGDLGWIYPGDTVPEFERAMMALSPGAISEPVRTPFGVHLIQVLDRRTDDASPERVRQQAREILRMRRIEERYEDWLRQLRDSTYVEYKLDGN